MYIENGIAYAGEKPAPIKICGVRPMPQNMLWVRFNTGEAKIYDMTPILTQDAFAPLKNFELFKSVYIDYGVPVWKDGEIDIAPEELYQNGVPAPANA